MKRNIAIAFVYTNLLDSPEKSEWKDKLGTTDHICKHLKIPKEKKENSLRTTRTRTKVLVGIRGQDSSVLVIKESINRNITLEVRVGGL